MRIVAGAYGGRALTPVGKGDAGAQLRPTADRVRESLFSMLAHLDVIEGAHVLDLFAGTGALGLEGVSRGAVHATFVDRGRVAQSLIRRNIDLLGCADQCSVIGGDAHRLGPAPAPCQLVFLDPPYGKELGLDALIAAQAGGWIAPEALIVWEEKAQMTPPPGFTLHKAKRFGDSWMTLLWAD